MQPVRREWDEGGAKYELNLIDTPGHVDFSYEVSRALTAVEGAILLVDATQGVQAQTLTTLRTARELGLVIIPAISKIDSPLADIESVKTQVVYLLGVEESSIILCSGKTGEGVDNLLFVVFVCVLFFVAMKLGSENSSGRLGPQGDPVGSQNFPRQASSSLPRALIFDFQYSDHQGVIVYLRMFEGAIKKGDALEFAASGRRFNALEVGTFSPKPTPRGELGAGSIGYIVTGIKEPGVARVGDTVRERASNTAALPGYAEPKPVVWASIYPESQDEFITLRQALERLRLSDSSLSFEEEASGVLGRGYRCGLLGMLHLEIITERLRRVFNLTLVVTTPTITFEVELEGGERKTVYSPSAFPEYHSIKKVWEPYVEAEIILPAEFVGAVMPLLFEHEAVAESTDIFSEGRMSIRAVMPLRELMRNFFDKLKSISAGYASISYELRELREADVVRLDVLVAEEIVPAFSRIVARHRVDAEAIAAVEKLYKILPRQMFAAKIQGVALGRIISSQTLPAMSKNVTQHMYGGDRTRKMKLWKKQKEGKARMKREGKVNIPEDVFLKMVKSE